jgi:hypothetical protein
VSGAVVTSRDLLEAQAFHRRRVVAAFVSGAADHPSTERPGERRALVVGIVLALVLLGVDAVRGGYASQLHLDPPTRARAAVDQGVAQPVPGTSTRVCAGACRAVPSSRTT